jgi:phosphatidylserine/phosphatidylglycerophosphate/cardiolipin synthase-like enzyme
VQRFLWWDYAVKPGDAVQYSVVPVIGSDKENLILDTKNSSPTSPELKIAGQRTSHLSAYFNKGIIAAQWVSRALDVLPENSKITDLVAQPGNALRNELSGLLRPAILSLLSDTKKNNGKIFAALYELNDRELIEALAAFGKDCNLILANGAFKSNAAGKNDENKDVRAQLKSKITLFDRIVKTGHFAHNKFVVFCDAHGTPQRVLTGSTNWTFTGLCTQANNGIVIDDPNVAADYLQAWQRIKAAGNDYPRSLVTGNSSANTRQVDGCRITPWFVKTSAGQDLEYARKLINSAKEGILFLFFNPGSFQEAPTRWTLLQNILERHNQSNPNFNSELYFCGVVNQEIALLTNGAPPQKHRKQRDVSLDPTAAPNSVALYQNGIEPPQRLSHDVLVPHNIKEAFHDWEKELLSAGIVNIHSKVIVLDPFGDNPVVMTGSHNLGFKASNANDDNLIIIEGNASLAKAYAINIVAIFQTYRWNSYVEAHRKDPNVWHGLVDNDQWQSGYLSGNELKELKFWLGARSVGAGVRPSGGASADSTELKASSGSPAQTRENAP